MNDFQNRILPDWPRVLREVLARAAVLKSGAVLAFDLDSTLFDNRPRQSRIVREYGQERNVVALERCRPEDWTSGWDMRAAMRNCGLAEPEVERLFPEVKAFWQERFFTSPYCLDDEAIEGAAAFTLAVRDSGAQLAYVTGRHEGMRDGSVGCMARWGLAIPDGARIHLIMKPRLADSDDEFKRIAHQRLRELGTVIAAFDNEPMHVNDYRRNFPEAAVIHLATDHSGRPIELLEGIVTVPHFGL